MEAVIKAVIADKAVLKIAFRAKKRYSYSHSCRNFQALEYKVVTTTAYLGLEANLQPGR